MTNPLSLYFFNDHLTNMMYIFGFISVLPTLLYVAFKRKDNGSAGGIVGYYLTKLLRKLR